MSNDAPMTFESCSAMIPRNVVIFDRAENCFYKLKEEKRKIWNSFSCKFSALKKEEETRSGNSVL